MKTGILYLSNLISIIEFIPKKLNMLGEINL